MTNLNVAALLRLTFAVLPRFKWKNQGTLINIGSTLGFQSLPVSSIYSATKAYVHLLTRGLQVELADTKVVVHLVLPAATATDLWENFGVPLSALNPDHLMTVEACVDASLRGLDIGETVTIPSVDDLGLLSAYDGARLTLFQASQSGTPASRYSESLDRSGRSGRVEFSGRLAPR